MNPSHNFPPGNYVQPDILLSQNPRHSETHSSSNAARIKKSMSTPDIREQTSADVAALALSAEKRRNKLGYHRTSVACGHCRRRKIRCIAAPGDPQNRCSNCIRLKKECIFYPVDQQPQPETRTRGSKASSGADKTSEPGSPSTSSRQMQETSGTLPYLSSNSHLSMSHAQESRGHQSKKPKTGVFGDERRAVSSPQNFDFGHSPANWISPDTPSSTVRSPSDMQTAYWRNDPSEIPLASNFPQYVTNMPISSAPQWAHSQAEETSREEPAWSIPQRSISYSNLEGLQTHSQYSYPQHPSQAPLLADQFIIRPRTVQHPDAYAFPAATSAGVHHPQDIGTVRLSEETHQSHPLGSHYTTWPQNLPYEAWQDAHLAHSHISEEVQSVAPGYSYADPPSAIYYPPPPRER